MTTCCAMQLRLSLCGAFEAQHLRFPPRPMGRTPNLGSRGVVCSISSTLSHALDAAIRVARARALRSFQTC